MNFDGYTLFFALLAFGAQVAAAIIGGLLLASRFVPSLRPARDTVVASLGPHAYWLGVVVALVCLGGSLYLSEVAHLVPCRLCWVQRGFMYPQVVLFGLAAVTGWRWLRPVIIVSVAVGGAVSVYHMLLERFPDIETDGTCDVYVKCSTILVERLGYITIPTMAFSGFALLLVLAILGRPLAPTEEP